MKIQKWLVAAILSGVFSTTLLAAGEKLDTARIDELTGLKGKMNEKEGVYKVTFPRNDVKVSVAGWEMPPFMGLGTWAAFQGTNDKAVTTWAACAGSDDNAVVDGDCAVTENELQPVLKSLLESKIKIVAIHQHMTHEEPRIMFFHYWGRGAAKDLAQAVKGGFLIGGLLKVTSPAEK